MTINELQNLKIGDYVIPTGRCKDKRTQVVMGINDNEVLCAVLAGNLMKTTYLDMYKTKSNHYIRPYRYQNLKVVKKDKDSE